MPLVGVDDGEAVLAAVEAAAALAGVLGEALFGYRGGEGGVDEGVLGRQAGSSS